MTKPTESAPSPGGTHAPAAPARRWDLARTGLVVGGLLLAVLAVFSAGSWFPFGTLRVSTRLVAFALAFLLTVLGAQGASHSYVSGRWGRAGAWIGATVVLVGGELLVLHALSSLPEDLHLPAPRTVVLVLGVVLVVWGLSRDSDVAHEREGAQDWFTRTERILNRPNRNRGALLRCSTTTPARCSPKRPLPPRVGDASARSHASSPPVSSIAARVPRNSAPTSCASSWHPLRERKAPNGSSTAADASTATRSGRRTARNCCAG